MNIDYDMKLTERAEEKSDRRSRCWAFTTNSHQKVMMQLGHASIWIGPFETSGGQRGEAHGFVTSLTPGRPKEASILWRKGGVAKLLTSKNIKLTYLQPAQTKTRYINYMYKELNSIPDNIQDWINKF